ncbi:sensor histidine kinase [Flaviaesturariibacter amylovorans]|uniref:Sensor histidine kinase n=1 Tax=Flaviaesturariibacter amylovorans TaxID=1084520 RepID=A0ABP8G4U6_9BACT
MKTKQRFQFWNVFWVVLGLFLAGFLFTLLITSMSPVASKEFNWKELLTVNQLIYQVFTLLFVVLYYYITLNGYYRLLVNRRSFLSFLRYSILIALALIGYYVLSYHLSPQHSSKKQVTTGLIVVGYFMGTVFYLGVSLLLSYFVFLRDERKQRKVLEEQKLQLEIEKSQANYNFLKAQINPHFLHNTLNFLYAKSLPYSNELSEGILTLSDIMRYALSDGNTRDGKAPLKDEVEHVRNVIKINQLRYSNKLNVHFEVEGVINGATIIPFVLITIVENAFKHGDFKSEAHPIRIRLRVEHNAVVFSCTNKKKTGPKELSTGIGLQNIKTRLDLAYGPAARLEVKEDADIYTTELTIDRL